MSDERLMSFGFVYRDRGVFFDQTDNDRVMQLMTANANDFK